MTSLSVVIPTLRAAGDLHRCLRSLAEQGYPELEVIVVDNGSPGVTAAGVRVIRNEENTGFVGACNQGLAAASGELVLLLNDDTEVEAGALSELAKAMERHPRWGACQAMLLLLSDPSRVDSAGSFLTATGFLVHRGIHGPADEYTAEEEIFAAKGAALLLRRRALEDAGVLDPEFFVYFEETDLCWRLWLSGWEVGLVPAARVLHDVGVTSSALSPAFVQFHSYKNRIRTLLKNLGPLRLTWMLPFHLGICVALVLWYLVRGRFAVSRGIVRALWWNVTHLGGTLQERRRIQRGRSSSDRELMPRITRPPAMRAFLTYARVD
jgi:N-acetylglucosaminyl-diphospho-decaprenol L-rhamnosyltransferase